MSAVDELQILRAFLEASTDGVVAKDRTGRYVLCNPAAAELLGRTCDEIVGRTDHELFDEESAAARVAIDQQVIASGATDTHEERTTITGQPRLVQVRKVPYRSASGEVGGVVVVARDISSHERAELKIQQSESLLRLVIDALPVGVVVMNARGDVVLRSLGAQRIWGKIIQHGDERYQRSRAWWHATGIPLEPHEWASVRTLAEGVECHDQIIDIEAFDGERRVLRNSAVPIRGSFGIEGAVALLEDITDRVRLERELAQSQKMEAVGRLAGGIAHDFNNLLMVIQGYAELVLAGLVPADPRREDLGEIQRAAESAAGLTRQLLAFGRRDVTHPSHVTVESVVATTDKMLSRVIGDNIRLAARLASPPHTVFVDPLQLEQVIVNLALNARDAMPAGGEITISTRSERDSAVIEVRDTGIGMDEHTRERIFEPYFTTKERTHGSGLGLATVHSIVERAGGTIRVASEPGRGSTFTITLPLSTPDGSLSAAAGPPPVRETEGIVRTAAILVVEDSRPVRVAVRAMLERLGYVVHDVASGDEALEYIDAGGVADILLTDVMLEGLDGRQLAREIEQRRPGTPVVLMSGYADDDVMQDGASTQWRLLNKPFSFTQLADAIRDALAERQGLLGVVGR